MSNPKFQIFVGDDEQYYFRLRARNGEIILRSEAYKQKAGCENGIESVKVNSPDDDRYQRKDSIDGQYYFNLTATNGEVIGTSEMYTTVQGRDSGIAAVKDDAPNAPIEDMTQ